MPKLTQKAMKKAIGKQMARFGISAFSIGSKKIESVSIPRLNSCTVDGMTGKVVIHVGDKVRVTIEEEGVLGKAPAVYTISTIIRAEIKGAYNVTTKEGSFFLTSNKHSTITKWLNRFEILERAK